MIEPKRLCAAHRPRCAGHVCAGLANGDVWYSSDQGDTWNRLPLNLKGIHRTLIVI
jgi:hypothetical protein